jgi:polar amino acid transport system substrate-binding protein
MVLSAYAQQVVVRIGAEDDWAPFSSVRGGKPYGMAVELVQAIFAEAGIPLELVPLPYARCMEDAKRGRLAGCFDTLPDAALRKDYFFHAQPLFVDELWILGRTANTAVNLKTADLSDKRVIITHGYTYGDAFETNAAIRRITAPHDINALRMLVAERGEFAVVYRRITQHLERGSAQDLRGKFKRVGKLEDAALYLSFSRQYPDVQTIVSRFESAHTRLIKNGSLQKIEKRWN